MKNFRFDWKKVIEKNEDGFVNLYLIPDPNRYSQKIVNGEEGYWDKFDEIFLSSDVIKQLAEDLAKSLRDEQIFDIPKRINDIEIYTEERIKHLNSNFEDGSNGYQFYDKSEEFLASLKEDKKRFVIISIDIVGSTKMSQELSVEKNSKIIQLFSREISQLINGYNGYVLKFQGDGIIAYFPEPNYLGMNDNAIECAHSIKYFIINGLNKILNNNGFPPINFRIGLDSGEAMILIVGSKESKTHKDLIGLTINLATKIQGLAEPDQILAGEATIMNAYYIYRTWFDKIILPEDWKFYKNSELKYQVFSSKL